MYVITISKENLDWNEHRLFDARVYPSLVEAQAEIKRITKTCNSIGATASIIKLIPSKLKNK